MNRMTAHSFIPAKATIEELAAKASDCEKHAEEKSEQDATALRDEAKILRAWIATLKSGRWTA